jgi:hypothetical protein
MDTVIQILEESVASDTFPHDPYFDSEDPLLREKSFYRVFRFNKCNDIEEVQNLFGLYIGMVKLHSRYKKEDFLNYINANKMIGYIRWLYSGNVQSYYSRWFANNYKRFLAPNESIDDPMFNTPCNVWPDIKL